MPYYEHGGKKPNVDPSTYVAPNAVLVGDVTVGPGCAILFGAVISAESGPVAIGKECIIMENAVLRGVARQPLQIGDNVLVGPHAHLTGCNIEDRVFLATGAAVFNGAHIGAGSTVRIHGIVHARTRLPENSKVNINLVAIGDPAEILLPNRTERLEELLLDRDFAGTAFGLPREKTMVDLSERYLPKLREFRNLKES